jgi:hypothetical protein
LQHQGEVHAEAFSPDVKMVLTGSEDKTARLWDAATGTGIGPHCSIKPAFAPWPLAQTAGLVLTGSYDVTARLWAIPLRAAGSQERVALWVQVLTGKELDEHGAVRLLDAGTWHERRRRLEELGGPPDK